jgi:hypothetical protein
LTITEIKGMIGSVRLLYRVNTRVMWIEKNELKFPKEKLFETNSYRFSIYLKLSNEYFLMGKVEFRDIILEMYWNDVRKTFFLIGSHINTIYWSNPMIGNQNWSQTFSKFIQRTWGAGSVVVIDDESYIPTDPFRVPRRQ